MKIHSTLSMILLSITLAACGGHPDIGHEQKALDDHEEGEPVKGEHGGRMLTKDGFGVELAIAEDGIPPKFQAWAYKDGEALPPEKVRIQIKLQRLGKPVESHILKPLTDGSLMANTVVEEPHSFDVLVLAEINGKKLAGTIKVMRAGLKSVRKLQQNQESLLKQQDLGKLQMSMKYRVY